MFWKIILQNLHLKMGINDKIVEKLQILSRLVHEFLQCDLLTFFLIVLLDRLYMQKKLFSLQQFTLEKWELDFLYNMSYF